MSKLDIITQKILEDARERVRAIEEASQTKIDSLIGGQLAEAKSRSEENLVRVTKAATEAKTRALQAAHLKKRDEVLRAKYELISQVLTDLKSELKKLGDAEYEGFIRSTLDKLELDEKAELVVPADKIRLVESLGFKFPVHADDKLESGFQIHQGNSWINYDFSALVDFSRDKLEPEILLHLFAEAD